MRRHVRCRVCRHWTLRNWPKHALDMVVSGGQGAGLFEPGRFCRCLDTGTGMVECASGRVKACLDTFPRRHCAARFNAAVASAPARLARSLGSPNLELRTIVYQYRKEAFAEDRRTCDLAGRFFVGPAALRIALFRSPHRGLERQYAGGKPGDGAVRHGRRSVANGRAVALAAAAKTRLS